jgi:BTB/POZ domain
MDMGTCIGKLALNTGILLVFDSDFNVYELEFSDIQLVVGQDGEVFPAHKLILAARCEYFRKMFYGTQMKEARDSVCTFMYDDPRVFRTMIYHLYARPIEEKFEPRHLVMCLVTAEKYGIGKTVSPPSHVRRLIPI